MNRPLHHRRKAGSALILVFWCLLLLSLAVFAVVEIVELSVEHAAHEQTALQAQTAAASGIAIAQEPQLKRDDPVLAQEISPGYGFKASISSEGARLNLNYLLLTNHREVLVSLFTRWGMTVDAAQHAAACLYDWVTPGDLPTLNGAKAEAYERAGLPQRPSHQAFTSWDEVALVMGLDAVEAAKPDWRDSFTLWSDGPLDVTQAPAELIAALLGVEPGRVEPLVQMRDGRDGIPGTADDVPLDAGELQGILGLSDAQMKALQNQFAFGGSVRRIESIGYAGAVHVKISVVTRLSANPQLLVWSER
jgi:type II secretory pathway component PulK